MKNLVAFSLIAALGITIGTPATSTAVSIDYTEICERVGGRYDVSPEFLEALIEETNTTADVSKLVTEYIPGYEDRMADLDIDNLNDPSNSIEVSADYLVDLFEKYTDPEKVLAMYLDVDLTDTQINTIVEKSYQLETEHGKHDY